MEERRCRQDLENIGLKDGRHITNIIVHPTDPNTVWAGVMGHLFGPNAERGVFKTTDGGKSWKKKYCMSMIKQDAVI